MKHFSLVFRRKLIAQKKFNVKKAPKSLYEKEKKPILLFYLFS